MLDSVTDIVPSDDCVLIIPSYNEGHAEYRWNKNDPKDVEQAREAFIKQKAKGYLAYRVDPKTGDKGEVIKEFDPSAEKIIMVPPIAGG